MKRRMHLLLLLSALSAITTCGDGRWGSELRLGLRAADGLSPGDRIALGVRSLWELEIQRVCLSVEAMAMTEEGAATSSDGGEDCFCHGDPPHCHGDCTEPTTTASLVSRSLHWVVDLLAADSELTLGIPPGTYRELRLAIAPPHEEHDHADAHDAVNELPPACADLEHSALLLDGTLIHTTGATAIPLTIDLREIEVVTETLDASPPLVAEVDETASVHIELDITLLLQHLDPARLTPAPGGSVVIGGPDNANPADMDALVTALAGAVVYQVGP